MKSRYVDTIASAEENLRFQIFDGVIPLEEAGAELMRLERTQHRHAIDHALTQMRRAERARMENDEILRALSAPSGFKARCRLIWLALSYRHPSVSKDRA